MKQDFKALETTQKGYAGEYLVKNLIERSGWIVYESTADVPHVIDFVCMKKNGPGLIAVDVKTYPRRWCCHDTGIDYADFEKYHAFEQETGIAVHIVFVDEIEAAVYGQRLRELATQARPDGNKVYFPLEAMRLHRYLHDDEVDKIRAVSTTDATRYQGSEMYFTLGRVRAMAGR